MSPSPKKPPEQQFTDTLLVDACPKVTESLRNPLARCYQRWAKAQFQPKLSKTDFTVLSSMVGFNDDGNYGFLIGSLTSTPLFDTSLQRWLIEQAISVPQQNFLGLLDRLYSLGMCSGCSEGELLEYISAIFKLNALCDNGKYLNGDYGSVDMLQHTLVTKNIAQRDLDFAADIAKTLVTTVITEAFPSPTEPTTPLATQRPNPQWRTKNEGLPPNMLIDTSNLPTSIQQLIGKLGIDESRSLIELGFGADTVRLFVDSFYLTKGEQTKLVETTIKACLSDALTTGTKQALLRQLSDIGKADKPNATAESTHLRLMLALLSELTASLPENTPRVLLELHRILLSAVGLSSDTNEIPYPNSSEDKYAQAVITLLNGHAEFISDDTNQSLLVLTGTDKLLLAAVVDAPETFCQIAAITGWQQAINLSQLELLAAIGTLLNTLGKDAFETVWITLRPYLENTSKSTLAVPITHDLASRHDSVEAVHSLLWIAIDLLTANEQGYKGNSPCLPFLEIIHSQQPPGLPITIKQQPQVFQQLIHALGWKIATCCYEKQLISRFAQLQQTLTGEHLERALRLVIPPTTPPDDIVSADVISHIKTLLQILSTDHPTDTLAIVEHVGWPSIDTYCNNPSPAKQDILRTQPSAMLKLIKAGFNTAQLTQMSDSRLWWYCLLLDYDSLCPSLIAGLLSWMISVIPTEPPAVTPSSAGYWSCCCLFSRGDDDDSEEQHTRDEIPMI